MDAYRRYAVYHTPEGALARFGAEWLGWDAEAGKPVEQPQVAGLDLAALTETPRRYGFHATIKAPFRLAEGQDAEALLQALRGLAAAEAAVPLPGGLRLARVEGFLALVPAQDSEAMSGLESRLVRGLDRFRAPLTEKEIASRKPERLTPRQRENLEAWGYPHVLEEFRFHMTLTGDLDGGTADEAEAALRPRLEGLLADPYPLSSLSLMGEDRDGCFHQLARVPLTG